MAEKTFAIDPELLSGFLDDSLDELELLDNLFVRLESEPGNLDIISSIFRPVHSIKGNSAFFGLLGVKKLAHEMETLLDLVRKKQLVPNQSIVNALLAGVDELKEMLVRTRGGQSEIDNEVQFNEVVVRVTSAKKTKEDIKKFLSELYSRLEKLKNECCELESLHLTELGAIVKMVLRLREDGAGEKGVTSEAQRTEPEALRKIKSKVSQAEKDTIDEADSQVVLNCLKELKALTEDAEAQQILDAALDGYHTMIDTVGFDSLLCELLHEKMEALGRLDVWKTSRGAREEEFNQVGAPQYSASGEGQSSTSGRDLQKTMRVSEESIDNFLAHVGDMIIVGEMYRHLQKRIADNNKEHDLNGEFKRVNETFDNLSLDLQESIMEIRKVPIHVILQKVPRMIRDIAAASGKQIKVELEGEDIKVDKRLIETLDAPLMHMTRNAADHGIEMPDVRKACGKDAQGTVRIVVRENDDDVVLTLSDDGKGLDHEAIKAKAVKLGLVKAVAELSDEEVTDLLFVSGVSTAEQVTEVSGRGVGMDVVRRSIEEANGQIKVSSTLGAGSQFVIRLPKAVSTQIIEGYLVRIGGNCYVIGLDEVREVFRAESREISTVTDRGECVRRHDKLLPVVKLFGSSYSVDDEAGAITMVSLEVGNKQTALYVDEVVGIQRVVLKDLDGLEVYAKIFSAAAVLGDGTIAMVLNVDCLQRKNVDQVVRV